MSSYPYGNVPLGQPPLRQSDLDEDSSRYDHTHAAPSDDFLRHTWIGWSSMFYVMAGFNLLVLLSVIFSRRARRKAFNLYLIYLMAPDVFYTGMCAFWCAVLAAKGGFMHPAFCKIQSMSLIAGITANSWLNAVIAWEIHKLLNCYSLQLPYRAPTRRAVARNAILVYLFSFFLGSWGLIEEWESWLPHRINAYNGFVCIPMAYDRKSSVFFFAVFYPLMNGIPLAFSLWATFDILWHNKLPSSGKRRELAIYFFRIILVFLIMWLPGLFCFFVLGGTDPWYVVVSGAWSHSQGAVSAAVSLLKPDIYEAFKKFLRCQCWQDDGRSSSHRLASTLGDRSASQRRSTINRVASVPSSLDSTIPGNNDVRGTEISASPDIMEAGCPVPDESVPTAGEPRRGPLAWLTRSRLLMGEARSLSKRESDRALQDSTRGEPAGDEDLRGAYTESLPSALSKDSHHAETVRTQTTEVDRAEAGNAEQVERNSSEEPRVSAGGIFKDDEDELDVDDSA